MIQERRPLKSLLLNPFNTIDQCFVRRRVNYSVVDFSTATFADVLFDPELRKTQWLTVPHCECEFPMMAVQPILLPAELLGRLVYIQKPVSLLLPVTFDLRTRDVEIVAVEYIERSDRLGPEYPCRVRVEHPDLPRVCHQLLKPGDDEKSRHTEPLRPKGRTTIARWFPHTSPLRSVWIDRQKRRFALEMRTITEPSNLMSKRAKSDRGQGEPKLRADSESESGGPRRTANSKLIVAN